MKSLKILIISIFTVIMIVNTDTAKAQVVVSTDVTFSVFHENLMNYGRWVYHPTYGQVWVANAPGFVPYRTRGHWVYTEDGWTWVSRYRWGWATFHYGRWDYDPAYGGYFWVPGYEWGPAWVSWRRSNDVYGWAPLTPSLTIGIGINFGSEIPAERWTFVPPQYITHPYISRYYIAPTRNVTIINNTTIINNVHNNSYHTVVIGGPQRTEVENVTHTKINTYVVNNAARPSGATVVNNTINIYRPVVNKTTVVNKTVVNNIHVVKNNTTVINSNKTVINNNQRKTVVNNNNKVVTKPVSHTPKTDTTKSTHRVVKKPVPKATNTSTTPVVKPVTKPKPQIKKDTTNKKPQR